MSQRLSVLLLLCACDSNLGDVQGYYPTGAVAPTISGLSPDSEDGNLGGQVVTITGAHFGDDPNALTVVFGGQNAEIVSVSDAELVVRPPHGPFEGGAVQVSVGTPDGLGVLAGGYTYVVDDVYDDQVGYIMATNSRYSTMGIDGYIGAYGIDGVAEFYETPQGRVHTPLEGFWGAGDSAPAWAMEVPDLGAYTEWIDDLRVDLGRSFTLENPALDGEEKCYHQDLSYVYSGGVVDGEWTVPYTVTPVVTVSDDCDQPGEVNKDLSVLAFCQQPAQPTMEPRYVADWPVNRNFFSKPGDSSSYDGDVPVEITLNVPEAGIDGVVVTLPEPAVFLGVEGFNLDDATTEDQAGWASSQSIASCFDDDGDGDTTLDETALAWAWTPSSLDEDALLEAAREANGDGVVKDVRISVNASVSYGLFSWLGLESTAIRASVEVPDDDGRIDLPVSVLYQFPTMNSGWGGGVGRTQWGDPLGGPYGFLIYSINRVVEYRVASELGGDVVFAYVNADLGFTGWTHPADLGDCGDCLDGDGDGWTDGDDPDCGRDGPGVEQGFGTDTCNDGEDNDGDNQVDSEDTICESADDVETNCADGRDNDRDGLTDEEDCECMLGLPEAGEDTSDQPCCDGSDNDGDGWIDQADPSCEGGVEDGLLGTECNDGVDNDGFNDIDAADLYCQVTGAEGDAEQPELKAECIDGEDNDGDGYLDANDPNCDVAYNGDEDRTDEDIAAMPTCADGEDNDGDGAIDAADTDCALEDGTPNGFQSEGS